jgi:hypothetical protein
MKYKMVSAAFIAASLLGSTLAASAQAGGAEGPAAATVPGPDVRAGEQGRMNVQPGVTTGSAGSRSNDIRSESQYTIGNRGGKPSAEEAAPAGH